MMKPKCQFRSVLRATAATPYFLLVIFVVCSRSFADREIRITPNNFDHLIPALAHASGPTRVIFSAGDYFLTSPVVINHWGDGPLVLEAQGRVVFSAGLVPARWEASTFNGHECLTAHFPGVEAGRSYFRELWVNGKRAQRARFPATGYLAASMPADNKAPWNQGQNWFGYKPGEVPEDLHTTDVEAVIMNRWVEAHLPVSRIDPATHRIESAKKSAFQLLDGDLYYLEGSPRFFEHPGDWYLDRAKGMLYYLPREGESVENLNAVVPQSAGILTLSGVNHVTIRGITFSHSEWNLPETRGSVGGFGQAAVGVPAAVSLDHCISCKFENCTFEHLGNYCLELGRGCQNDSVNHCTFRDFGAGAIKIGTGEQSPDVVQQAFGNSVADCRITDGGQMFPSACGIWIGQSFGNTIEHNEIADLYYSGISVGWTWGYGDSLSRDNYFIKNLVHDIGRKSDGDGPILSDMGGIYTLGARSGTVISGNVFHDISGRVYGGWGIYLDEGSSNVLIEKNLVYKTTHGGFHLHYGHDNIVQSNIFALGRDVQIARTRVEAGQRMLTFKHNVVYWTSGVFTETSPDGVDFADNLYQCAGDNHLKFGGKSWDQWQQSGQDVESVLGDAGFANPGKGDFSMPAIPQGKVHIQPLDVGDVGPRDK